VSSRKKYRIMLVEVPGTEMVPYSPPPEPEFEPVELLSPGDLEMQLLLQCLQRLQSRGEGDAPWTRPHHDEPLTFLLDAVSDAWIIRHSEGGVIFANEAAKLLELEARSYQRFEEFEVEQRRYTKRGLTYSGLTIEVATLIRG
jgi:hypothetical protein